MGIHPLIGFPLPTVVACSLLLWGHAFSVDWTRSESFDVYILAGQSNMVGVAQGARLSAPYQHPAGIEDVQIVIQSGACFSDWNNIDYDGNFIPGKMGGNAPPNNNDPMVSTHDVNGVQTIVGPEVGPEQGIAAELAKGTRPVILLKYAWGGTGLEADWLSNTSGGPHCLDGSSAPPLLDDMVAFLEYNLRGVSSSKYVVKGIFWMQGETDAMSAGSASRYGINIKTLHARLKQELSRISGSNMARLPFVYGLISDIWGFSSALHQEQLRLERENPQEFNCESNSQFLPRMTMGPDYLEPAHYQADSYYHIGVQMAKRMQELLAGHNQNIHCEQYAPYFF